MALPARRTVALPALSTMFDACYEAEVLHLQPLPPTNLSASDRAVVRAVIPRTVVETPWSRKRAVSGALAKSNSLLMCPVPQMTCTVPLTYARPSD